NLSAMLHSIDVVGVGAVVGAVSEGGLAARAGLKPGDVVIGIDGVEAVDAATTAKLGRDSTIGRGLSFGIGRRRDRLENRIKIPPSGLDFSVTERAGSLQVTQASADSLAKKAGLSEGDRLLTVFGVPIRDIDTLKYVLSHVPAGSVVAVDVE